MSSQPKIRYPSGYQVPNVKVKVNPSQSKARYGGEGDTQNTAMATKVIYGGEGDTQNTPMATTTTAAFSVSFNRRNYSEFELLNKIQLMISQLQYNVFQQKCVSDKMLARHPRDLDIILRNDLWKDCFNYTLHIAVSFARHFQKVKENRPKVHFRSRNGDRSYEERDNNRPGTLTSAEIDLDQVGKCLYALDRVIQKYYAGYPGSAVLSQPSFSGLRSSRGLSGSLPRSKPGNRFDAVYPGPRTIGLIDMEAPLMRILDSLALDKNSFPTEEAFSLENVTIEPRASSRQTSNSSLTTPQTNYTNRNRMRSISISSDLSLSSTSEIEPESNYAASTPAMTSASASATSSRRSGRYTSGTAGYRDKSTNTTIDMNGDGDGTRVKPHKRGSVNKKKIVEKVKTKTPTTPMTPGTGHWSSDKNTPVPRAPRAGYGQRRRGEYSV